MKQLIALVVGLVLAFTAQAQQLKVATGSSTGTYSKMLKEASNVCGASINIVEQTTSGSMQNIDLLAGNQVNAALVQTDVLKFRANTENLEGIKTLLTLHPEEVHVLVADDSGMTAGGVGIGKFKVNADKVVFNTFKDLVGHKIGAVGGSYITAQVIRLQSEIQLTVVEYPDNKSLVAAVLANEVQAGLFVGGQPLGAISELKSGRLLPFSDDTVAKLKAVYRPARLNYSNIKQMGVNTVAVDAIFVTREYKTAKFIDALATLRGCIVDHIDEFKETTGLHPKWQAVDVTNKGKWPYYELPTAAVSKKK